MVVPSFYQKHRRLCFSFLNVLILRASSSGENNSKLFAHFFLHSRHPLHVQKLVFFALPTGSLDEPPKYSIILSVFIIFGGILLPCFYFFLWLTRLVHIVMVNIRLTDTYTCRDAPPPQSKKFRSAADTEDQKQRTDNRRTTIGNQPQRPTDIK